MLVHAQEHYPLHLTRRLERELDRVFGSALGDGCFQPPTQWPRAVDVRSEADAVTVRAELPGIEPSNIAVTVENGTLTIAGQRGEEKRSEGRLLARERSHGAFSHAFHLGDDLDPQAITAECRDGVLTVRIPKRAAAAPRQIEVQAG